MKVPVMVTTEVDVTELVRKLLEEDYDNDVRITQADNSCAVEIFTGTSELKDPAYLEGVMQNLENDAFCILTFNEDDLKQEHQQRLFDTLSDLPFVGKSMTIRGGGREVWCFTIPYNPEV